MRSLIRAVAIGAALVVKTTAGAQATTLAKGCDADNAGLKLPAGFCAGVFARGVPSPRHMSVAGNGDVFVISNSGRGSAVPRGVFRLRDANGDGKADSVLRVADGMGGGIFVANGAVYAEAGGATIVRYPFAGGTTDLTGTVDTIVTGLPRGGHATRDFVIRGNDLFVNVGSAGNVCQTGGGRSGQPVSQPDPCPELETRAGIWRFSASEKHQVHGASQRYAIGIRNGVGITLNPKDNELYATQHGRDNLGPIMKLSTEYNAENPGEEFFRIVEGARYGWPYCYYSHEEKRKVTAPEYGGDGKRYDRCLGLEPPIYAFPGHWAPNDALFYNHTQFPPEFRDGLFVAFHGSWNRDPLPQQGFNVTFLPMKDGRAMGPHIVFAEGFQTGGRRPSGLAQLSDGSLLVSDDIAGNIFRISYTGR